MDRSNIVELLAPTHTQDANGIWQESLEAKCVYCQVDSVTRNEFFEGGRNGLNPEFRVMMFRYDYNGEKLLRYDGRTYAVYRTYWNRDDTIELYVERQGGSNGKTAQG